MKQFLITRWFLIALVATFAVGAGFAEVLEPIAHMSTLRNAIVAAVLFVMAFPLEASAMWRALRSPWPPLLAVGVSFGLLPLFAWGVSFVVSEDFAPGLLVAAVTPCTLASASVWTRRAGGNDAVSILVTIVTNAICFVVTPLWLIAMTGREVSGDASEQLQLSAMTTKLGLLVVLPMAAAQLIRLHKPTGTWATARKVPLSNLAQCGILSMVFFGAIRTGLRLRGEAFDVVDVAVMLAAVILVHTVMLWVGVVLAKLLRFSREDQIAVAFAGSQKTLMVGLLVSISLGYSILPMVSYHVCQLFIDTLIADHFRKPTAGDGAGKGS